MSELPPPLRAFWDPVERARLIRLSALHDARAEGELMGRIHVCQEVLGLTPTPSAELYALSQAERTKQFDDLTRRLKGRQR